ncbi:MAG TPA: peptidase M10, partial [Chitinophagaceae bacterium]|nr:peptidase M10 [Chitinophagaceae bacterium]
MGSVETTESQLIISSHIITYGNAAGTSITEMIREEIETMWNEPGAAITIDDKLFTIVFRISAAYQPAITDIDIYRNLEPRNNYFRIEEFAQDNISFVDGLGCNTGYFKL